MGEKQEQKKGVETERKRVRDPPAAPSGSNELSRTGIMRGIRKSCKTKEVLFGELGQPVIVPMGIFASDLFLI